ncbi:YbgC/FadM family acyl-CoA thioesterase [Helicobacter sp. 23-1045]
MCDFIKSMLKKFRDSAVEFRQNLQGLVMSDFRVRIYYEDTDCGGIVYHTNYIKYCERARSEIFFGEGAMPNTDSIGLVVRKMNAEFLDSARLGDLISVRTRILKLGGSSLTLKQEIFLVDSWRESSGEKLIFVCEIKLACIDITRGKIAKIPSEILRILQHNFLGGKN